MKVLITGANGFLGQHLTLFLSKTAHQIIATSRGMCRIPDGNYQYRPVELTDEIAVKDLLREVKPQVIVHTAALSKPDECEDDRKTCIEVNVTATMHLIDHCRQLNSHFIYISTDFIFGENGPHAEDDLMGPLNFYGETKLQAENVVRKSGLSHAVVRPVFIYGKVWNGLRPSFLHWVKSNLENGNKIKVVNDQLRTPTFVNDICAGILSIIQLRKTGDFHLAGKDLISPYQMAVIVAKKLNLNSALIESVTADTFVEKVKRAKRSGLKVNKAILELGYDPVSFDEGVERTFH